MDRRSSLLAACLVVMSIRAVADTISFTSTKTLNLPVTADAMTLGPDGNLWILDSQHNAVGQLTPSGGYTSYPIATAQANPWVIATGVDGNLWFTEARWPGKIARVTPAGVVTEFPVPSTMAGFPWVMAATPDGSLVLRVRHRRSRTTSSAWADWMRSGTSVIQVPNAVKIDAIDPAVDGVWLFDDDPSANLLMKMHPDGTIAYSQSMPSTTYNGASAGVTALDGRFWFIHNAGLDRVEDRVDYRIPHPMGQCCSVRYYVRRRREPGSRITARDRSGNWSSRPPRPAVRRRSTDRHPWLPNSPMFCSFRPNSRRSLRRRRIPSGPHRRRAHQIYSRSICDTAYLLARQDVGSNGNMRVVSLATGSAVCSDLWIKTAGVSRAAHKVVSPSATMVRIRPFRS